MLLTLMCGCQKTLSQGQIESNLSSAISDGRPAQHIETILRQADNPVQAANHGIRSVMHLSHLPQDIEKNWQYYQPKEISQTLSIEIAKLLIKAGVDLQIKDRSGDTAVVTALGMRRKEMAMLLLEHTETIDTTDQDGHLIIRLAAAYDHPKCIEMLIARGADVNAVNKRGYTPLHAAAADRNEEIIAMLLEAGATVNPVNDESHTPLDIAMVKDNCPPDETKTNKVINLLTRHGAKRAAELKETNTPTVY